MVRQMWRPALVGGIAAIVLATAWADDRNECHQPAPPNLDRAIAGCTRLIEQAPPAHELASAHKNRGVAYGAKGHYDHAIQDLDKAIELNPHDATAHAGRGRVYAAKGNYDMAIADLTRAIGVDPRDATVFLSRGMAFAGKGELDRAILDYDKVIALDPQTAYASIA